MKIMRFEHVGLIKKEHVILRDISLAIEPGSIVGIAGPSGSGKSSLLRLMNLLESPTEGTILYKDKNIMEYDPMELRSQVGYVLQKPYIFAGTVEDNLVYAYNLRNLKPDKTEILKFMEKLNLTPDFLNKKRSEMSGGEQQRIALIRSLLIKPQVVLLDEITAALDENNTMILENFIKNLNQTLGITVIFVTHNPGQLKRLSQKVIYIKNGEVEFCDSADKYFSREEQING
ncbi:ABC transporter ATP-binding protein [Pectinatus sottacetonis]|uniref:ABC transporter ATP-binding protein n=1 Tax=Pectinatus sottacetonis TaxID=1002795 RepID=UPI0018C6973D|nr:ATP-binding cassette domain-containing protein [Pectinatus sottacetonis]